MQKTIVSILIFIIAFNTNAQDYNALLIPDSLKENADAVVRYDELDVNIISINKAIVKHKYAITVLNENGDKYAVYSNGYGTFTDLRDINGTLFDENGKKIKSVKKKDIVDMAEDDGYSFITSDREKLHDFFWKQYPYTVEYEDEQEQTGTYFLPYWMALQGQNISVEQSKFTVETPSGYQLRFKQFGFPEQSDMSQTSSRNAFVWQAANLKAIPYETWQPPLDEVTPAVFLGPTDFSWGSYNGNMSSWLNMGKFNLLLNVGKDILPDNIKQEVHSLTDGIKDTVEKIKILYNYLQNNTRYIGIQLGIGGWQPLPATFVAEKKYGDCKALSNYMISLLKEAGISANYVIVNAGKEKMYNGLQADFPAAYFNHIIACVPLQKDTIWLECTSQTKAFGYMGSFTGNRQALLIADDGGHVVNTPNYTMKDNQQIRNISAKLDADGNLTADITTHYTGMEQDELQLQINELNNDKLKESLKANIDLPTYDITSFHYDEHKDFIPSIDETLNLTAQNYAAVSGKRLFIMPDILNREARKLPTISLRKFDIWYRYSFREIDTVNIKLPPGFDLEGMPKDVIIANKFGSYEIHFKIGENIIIATRKLEIQSARFPPSDYPDLVKFYDNIFKADRSKMVLVKKDS
jgi:hypothetical protein